MIPKGVAQLAKTMAHEPEVAILNTHLSLGPLGQAKPDLSNVWRRQGFNMPRKIASPTMHLRGALFLLRSVGKMLDPVSTLSTDDLQLLGSSLTTIPFARRDSPGKVQ